MILGYDFVERVFSEGGYCADFIEQKLFAGRQNMSNSEYYSFLLNRQESGQSLSNRQRKFMRNYIKSSGIHGVPATMTGGGGVPVIPTGGAPVAMASGGRVPAVMTNGGGVPAPVKPTNALPPAIVGAVEEGAGKQVEKAAEKAAGEAWYKKMMKNKYVKYGLPIAAVGGLGVGAYMHNRNRDRN